MEKKFFIYIMASDRNGTLYIGLTSDLKKRIYEHKHDLIQGFTSKYNIKNLVYYEIFDNFDDAVKREKNMKAWKRKWKLEIIEKTNSNWKDLYEEILH